MKSLELWTLEFWAYVEYLLRSSKISLKSRALIVRYRQKKNEFLLFSIVLRILQLLITFEPLVRFIWGFHQNLPLQMSSSIKWKTEILLLHCEIFCNMICESLLCDLHNLCTYLMFLSLLQLFVKDNQGDEETTVIDYLGLIGTPVNTTKMDDFKRVRAPQV